MKKTLENIASLSADDLIGIPVTQPERLFAEDEKVAQRQWRELSRCWHPDRNTNSNASQVFSHICELRRAANAKRKRGAWQYNDSILLTARDGSRYRLRYQLIQKLDVGTAYVGKRVLCYLLEEDYDDLASIAEQRMQALPFADESMRGALQSLLPQMTTCLRLQRGSALVMRKTPEYVPLRHLLQRAGGAFTAADVAWMVSSLLNLVCYLRSACLTHQAIDLDHLLVAPQEHSLALTGGWWYAGPEGAALMALPARSARLAPPDILATKTADIRLDQLLVRETGRELLGDGLGKVPEAMLRFLELPPRGCPVTDYEHWQDVLLNSFGERRFTPLAITADDVYGCHRA